MSNPANVPMRAVTIEVVVLKLGHSLPKHEHPQVLMLQLDGIHNGAWSLPSGILEDHQSLAQSAMHSLQSDTGLVIQPDQLRFVTVNSTEVALPKLCSVNLIYRVTFREHAAVLNGIKPGMGIKDVRWVSLPSVFTRGFGPIAFDHARSIKQATTGFKS